MASDLNNVEHFECQQTYFNAEDAIVFLPKNQVDICLVDIGLPRTNGLEAIHILSKSCPGTQFCMFTMFEDDDKIFESLKAGAKGYILKGEKEHKIHEFINDLHQGGSPMSHNIARRVLNYFQNTKISFNRPELPITYRETEILTLLSRGLLYKEISDEMGITIGTVKQHIHRIYEKLHVSNRTEAINLFNKT